MSLNTPSQPVSAAGLLETMRPCFDALPAGPLVIALSGGGDSVALLLLAKIWCEERGREIRAVTVDHNLRPESAGEAQQAKQLCEDIGVGHQTLVWQGWDGSGNLQDAARGARRDLIARWVRGGGIAAVALGHTMDDQAENYLLRLARGSGVDGLAGMKPHITGQGVAWLRPMLGLRRESLRNYLRAQKVSWTDDPSNEDARFDRVRARGALAELQPLGITTERLATTAGQMSRARAALEQATLELARVCATPGLLGDVVIDPQEFLAAPEEIRLRLMAASLKWVSSAPYRPRLNALSALCDSVLPDGLAAPATLHGCILRGLDRRVTIRREPGREEARKSLADLPWDGRWSLSPLPEPQKGFQIGALREDGLAQWPDWRDSGYDRELLLTSPAIWGGERLIASAAGKKTPEWPLCLIGGSEGYFATIISR